MKRSFTPYLILLVSLVVILCCRQQKEEAAPVSTCRTVRIILKSNPVDDQPTQNEETVEVGDETVKVSFYRESTYAYDKQGRLIREKDRVVTGDSSVVEYVYSPGLVLKQTTSYSRQLGTHISIDSIVLNTQGLAESKFYQQKVKYDSEGYLTEQTVQTSYGRYMGQVVNGNLIKEYKELDWLYIYNYSYDLTRAGQPPIHTFLGKGSRNLLMHEAIERTDFNRPLVYSTEYSYKFNEEGRVKRKISHSEKRTGWVYDAKVHTVVFDYEYDCSPLKIEK